MVITIKWFHHEYDLKEFSTKYPDVLFILTGVGEENYFEGNKLVADIWIKYFCNGKYYKDKLDFQFLKFDSNKLN